MRRSLICKRICFAPSIYDVDNNIDAMICSVRDPFATYVNATTYNTEPSHWTETQCMDTVAAGISECLGLPSGLPFEEVFSLIG